MTQHKSPSHNGHTSHILIPEQHQTGHVVTTAEPSTFQCLSVISRKNIANFPVPMETKNNLMFALWELDVLDVFSGHYCMLWTLVLGSVACKM